MYILSALFFIAVRFVAEPILNIIMLIVAKTAAAPPQALYGARIFPDLREAVRFQAQTAL